MWQHLKACNGHKPTSALANAGAADVMYWYVMAASSPMCVNAGAADVVSKAGDAKDSLQQAANSAGLE